MKTRTRQRRTVELSADQEALAQQVFARIQDKLNDELLDMVRAMVAKAPEEIFGPGGSAEPVRGHGVGGVAQRPSKKRDTWELAVLAAAASLGST